MKTILVTGGAGFLGSHLSKKLVDDGNFVICIDSLITGSLKNIQGLIKEDSFQFIECDITRDISLKSRIDEIYNLACPASPKQYQNNPIHTIKTNTLGVINILELAKKNNAKIFQASTSEIYGDPKVHPQDEKYWGNVNPIGIRSCYDEGKRCAESLFFDYHRQYGLLTKVGRIFNTYGPNMLIDDGRVISNFINQAINNKFITIYGDGMQTRSFCFVDDMIDAFVSIMNTDDDFCGPINIGNPKEYTILEIANKIKELTDSQSTIIFEDLPKDDPKRRRPSIELANEIINWNPSTNLRNGLIQTIDYFKNTLN